MVPVEFAQTASGPLMVQAGLWILAVAVQTAVQPEFVDVTVTVYVALSVVPAVTFTEEPVVALNVPFDVTDHT